MLIVTRTEGIKNHLIKELCKQQTIIKFQLEL